jgi:hypothetical protein
VVYAFSKDASGQAGLWRRVTFGGEFERVFCPTEVDVDQIDYDWFVSAMPKNPDVVYLGAVSLWKGEFKEDGTSTWTNISSRKYALDTDMDQQGIHSDQHAIAYGVDGAVYVGNDGGLFKSPDGGKHWQSLNKGLCITQFEYLAQHPGVDSWLLGGTQDNGTLRYEGGEVWYQVAVGDGGECATNDSAPHIVLECLSYRRTL